MKKRHRIVFIYTAYPPEDSTDEEVRAWLVDLNRQLQVIGANAAARGCLGGLHTQIDELELVGVEIPTTTPEQKARMN